MSMCCIYLFNQHYAPSAVNTYVLALGYSRKLFGASDPTKIFYITQMLKGYGKIGHRLDIQLPITLQILNKFIDVAPLILFSLYEVSVVWAMCVLAFFSGFCALEK